MFNKECQTLTFQKIVLICFNESSLKMMKNAFCLMLKALFVLEIFTFLSRLLGYAEKIFDKKAKVDFNIYDVTDWTTNNYNTHTVQHRQ